MVPEQILDSIDPAVAGNTSVKRYIKTARRKFRPKSPNDVDHYLKLAACIYVLGDVHSAVELLGFLDKNTGEYTCGRVDLAGSLANARLFLGYIYEQRGEHEKYRSIKSREGLSHSMNLDSVNPEYRNLIHETLTRNAEDLEFNENQEDLTRTYYLGFCYACMIELIIIKERLAEIQHTISEQDVSDLIEGIAHYRQKFISYLAP